MKYTIETNDDLGEVRINMTSNCYTDAMPLVPSLILRKQDVDTRTQSLPLALALLTAKHCGEIFEFAGIKIGNDYAEAIRRAIGHEVVVVGVDGMHRNVSTGEIDIQIEKASSAQRAPMAQRPLDNVQFARFDWSGDPVDAETRNSSASAQGMLHTNAALFADETTVNVALALIMGRDKVRTIHVPCNDQDELKAVNKALRAVSIDVAAVPTLEPAPGMAR